MRARRPVRSVTVAVAAALGLVLSTLGGTAAAEVQSPGVTPATGG